MRFQLMRLFKLLSVMITKCYVRWQVDNLAGRRVNKLTRLLLGKGFFTFSLINRGSP